MNFWARRPCGDARGLAPAVFTADTSVAQDKKWKIGFSQATTIEPWRAQFNKDIIAEAEKHPDVEAHHHRR